MLRGLKFVSKAPYDLQERPPFQAQGAAGLPRPAASDALSPNSCADVRFTGRQAFALNRYQGRRMFCVSPKARNACLPFPHGDPLVRRIHDRRARMTATSLTAHSIARWRWKLHFWPSLIDYRFPAFLPKKPYDKPKDGASDPSADIPPSSANYRS